MAGERAQTAVRAELFASVERQMAAEESDDPNYPYWRMTLRFGRMAMDMRLAWCDETLASLEALAADESAGEEPAYSTVPHRREDH